MQGGQAGGADRDRGAARLACGGWADQDRRVLCRGGDQGSPFVVVVYAAFGKIV